MTSTRDTTPKKKYASREDILKASEPPVSEICIREWNNLWVRVRGMDALTWQRFAYTLEGTNDPKLRVKMVAFCLVDPDGNLLFSQEDIEQLALKHFAPIRRISDLAFRLNRSTQADVEEMRENLSDGQGDGSPTA